MYNHQPWDPKIVAVVQKWPFLEVHPEKLLYTLAGWGLGRSLLTGGHCSAVAVHTGLTIVLKRIGSVWIG